MYQDTFYDSVTSYFLAEIEVGTHLYWEILGLKVHGQTLLMSWFVIFVLLMFAVIGTRSLKQIPEGIQNFMEYALHLNRHCNCCICIRVSKSCCYTWNVMLCYGITSFS